MSSPQDIPKLYKLLKLFFKFILPSIVPLSIIFGPLAVLAILTIATLFAVRILLASRSSNKYVIRTLGKPPQFVNLPKK